MMPVEKVKARRGEALEWLLARKDHASDECLIWPFARSKTGYGSLGRSSPHRRMCEIAHGAPSAPGLEAAHSCGNGDGGCVNPRHLRWASPSENRQDKVRHGTDARREKCSAAKLTEANVCALREEYTCGGISQRALARKYGVSQSEISRVLGGKRWLA